jgi:hypothetical protein
MIGRLTEQNESYQPLFEALGFSFDDLSKNSKEIADQISQIASLLKIRNPDDASILNELITLKNEEADLKIKLREIQNENKKFSKVISLLDDSIQDWRSLQEDIERERNDFLKFKRDVNDRIEDILVPKDAEYEQQINILNVTAINSILTRARKDFRLVDIALKSIFQILKPNIRSFRP